MSWSLGSPPPAPWETARAKEVETVSRDPVGQAKVFNQRQDAAWFAL